MTRDLIALNFLKTQFSQTTNSSTSKHEFLHSLQYVVLGPRVKVINLNILHESSCNELKYSLKIAFMFLSIILKFQVPDKNILLGIRKKATVFDGPWSASQVSSTKKCYSFHRKTSFSQISCIFFLFLMQLS